MLTILIPSNGWVFSWYLPLWPGADLNQILEISGRDFQLPLCLVRQNSSLPGIYMSTLRCVFSHVQLFVTPRTEAHQAPLSMGFSRQGYWRGLPLYTPGDLPDPGIKPLSLMSPALAGKFFTTAPPGKPQAWGILLLPLVAQTVKNLPAMRVWCLSREDPLEKRMATHSSILVWEIPWTEEPGRLQSMGSQRVRHAWATNPSIPIFLNLQGKRNNMKPKWLRYPSCW